jgi:hypothetical protein
VEELAITLDRIDLLLELSCLPPADGIKDYSFGMKMSTRIIGYYVKGFIDNRTKNLDRNTPNEAESSYIPKARYLAKIVAGC